MRRVPSGFPRIGSGLLLSGGLCALVLVAYRVLKGFPLGLSSYTLEAWTPSDVSVAVCVAFIAVGWVTTILTRASFILVGFASTLPFEIPALLKIVRDIRIDPTADNLWPIGLALISVSGFPAALGSIGASIWLVKRGRSASVWRPHLPGIAGA